MARRKQSTFEDLIAISARFPWWAGVALAVIAYLGLHFVATSTEVGTPTDLKQLSESAGKQLFKTLASFLQYVVPIAFLFGSVVSVFSTRKRRALYENAAANNDHLENMSWQDFELLVGEFFRRRGFSVKEVGGGGPDGGVDLLISSGKDRYVVQCKKWKARQIGVSIVRELYAVMHTSGAVGGFVVTSGKFTKEAQRFAEGREIELIDAEYLLNEVSKDRPAARPAGNLAAEQHKPACPICGSLMVLRKARNGPQAGDKFWGCPGFPDCRGTRALTAS